MADWNWEKIRIEYITGDTSYRKLAKIHGINATQIATRASKEHWVEEREQYRSKSLSKTLDKISEEEASRAARIYSVADKLLDKIEAMVDSEAPLDTKGVRALTAAVKDLKEIQSVKSALDEQEQKARIANLRKQANPEQQSSAKLVIEGLPEEFKV